VAAFFIVDVVARVKRSVTRDSTAYTGPGLRFAPSGLRQFANLVQAAEGVDQDQNRNRHAEQHSKR
jgi:hypothetical protein